MEHYLLPIVQYLSRWSIPLMLVGIPLYAHCRGVKVYERFVAGAEQGMLTAVRILPYLVAMWVALTLLRTSGTLDLLLEFTRPVLSWLGFPPEVLPLVIVRPLSGSGALSIVTELFQTYGPDSRVGMLASVMQGTTETTFYVVTVYLGAAGVHRARHALTAGLIGDVLGFLGAVLVCRLFFG
jgi:spore maturation protein B